MLELKLQLEGTTTKGEKRETETVERDGFKEFRTKRETVLSDEYISPLSTPPFIRDSIPAPLLFSISALLSSDGS